MDMIDKGKIRNGIIVTVVLAIGFAILASPPMQRWMDGKMDEHSAQWDAEYKEMAQVRETEAAEREKAEEAKADAAYAKLDAYQQRASNWLSMHPEAGKYFDSFKQADWARGRRYRVVVDAGSGNYGVDLLFYFVGEDVVTVYRNKPRELIWGNHAEY
jgi:hypothetical protein